MMIGPKIMDFRDNVTPWLSLRQVQAYFALVERCDRMDDNYARRQAKSLVKEQDDATP